MEISLKFVPKGHINNILDSIGSNNGLAPTRQQTIIWTNGGVFYWRMYVSLGLNEFAAVPAWINNYIHYKVWNEITWNCSLPSMVQVLKFGNG